jgi:hypothetical protein
LEKRGEVFGKAAGFILQRCAGVDGSRFDEFAAIRGEDAVKKGQSDAGQLGEPEFDRQEIVVTRSAAVTKVTLDDRENNAFVLELEEVSAKMANEFPAGGFEDVQVTGIVDVVADGAIGVGDAVVIVKNFGWHGGNFGEKRGSKKV